MPRGGWNYSARSFEKIGTTHRPAGQIWTQNSNIENVFIKYDGLSISGSSEKATTAPLTRHSFCFNAIFQCNRAHLAVVFFGWFAFVSPIRQKSTGQKDSAISQEAKGAITLQNIAEHWIIFQAIILLTIITFRLESFFGQSTSFTDTKLGIMEQRATQKHKKEYYWLIRKTKTRKSPNICRFVPFPLSPEWLEPIASNRK